MEDALDDIEIQIEKAYDLGTGHLRAVIFRLHMATTWEIFGPFIVADAIRRQPYVFGNEITFIFLKREEMIHVPNFGRVLPGQKYGFESGKVLLVSGSAPRI